MKNSAIITACVIAVLAALILRSGVYEIRETKRQIFTESKSGNIDSGASLVVHYHERRPYYLGKNGEVHGLVADPLAMVLELADIDFTWVETPAGRQLDIIRENNSITCAAGWFKTAEREQFAKYSLPIYQDKPFVGVTRADNELIGEEEILTRILKEGRLRFLVKVGYSYGTYIDDNIKSHKPWLVKTTGGNREMLNSLQKHRADYCLMTEEEAYDLILFSGVNQADFKIVKFNDIPQGNMRYLLCSLMTPDSLLESVNGAIKHKLPYLEKSQ